MNSFRDEAARQSSKLGGVVGAARMRSQSPLDPEKEQAPIVILDIGFVNGPCLIERENASDVLFVCVIGAHA
jgi:hypothetical protein